ncbi:MAG: hypothetical protein MK020_05280 [Dehalococcoidia bacterium]|nr:hypothetical protein [Dehalococcoidia bacterium]
MAFLTINRIRRLTFLDFTVLDEVRFDSKATFPSLAVASASMMFLGLGGWLWWLSSGLGDVRTVLIKSMLMGSFFSLALWLCWLVVAYLILKRYTDKPINAEELIRSAGIAAAPLAFGIFMVIPSISFGIGILTIAAWVLTTNEAIERVSGIKGRPVLLANIAGFSLWVICMSILATSTNQIAPGPFLAESIWEAIAVFDYGDVILEGN